MKVRLRQLGIVMTILGLVFALAGIFALTQVRAGYDSLEAFSEAQGVELSYNDDGQLVDRGTVEGADAIMALLEDDWGYPVNRADFDSSDPLVNTATEYMYQMATIGYHVLHGTQTVVLTEAVEYNGETFEAGVYEFSVDGRYWTGFARTDLLDGPARDGAWSGTAHALVAELGVGAATHSTLQLALGVAALLAGLGFVCTVMGAALIWASKAKDEKSEVDKFIESTLPQKELETV